MSIIETYKLLEDNRNMYKSKMIIRVFGVVVILGLILAITGGIISLVLPSAQQQNSTSNQSIMTETANQNITSIAVNTTTETNGTATNNIKNV